MENRRTLVISVVSKTAFLGDAEVEQEKGRIKERRASLY